jgi:hypothetical protein
LLDSIQDKRTDLEKRLTAEIIFMVCNTDKIYFSGIGKIYIIRDTIYKALRTGFCVYLETGEVTGILIFT